MKYADIVIDTKSDSVDNFFTYDASEFPDLTLGARVDAPFGLGRGRKMYGYVFALRDDLPEELEGKRILKLAEVHEDLSLTPDAISVCMWMRARYYCRYIEAAQCFAPVGAPRKRKPAAGGEGRAEGVAESRAEGATEGQSVDQADGQAESRAACEEGSRIESVTAGRAEGATESAAESQAVGSAEGQTEGRVVKDGVYGGAAEGGSARPGSALTQEQRRATEAILPAIEDKTGAVFLLHGVTGSGKTEVYLAAAKKALALGRKVIMLVPEISLTHQTVRRFVERFGHERIAILHSKLTLLERYEEWQRTKAGEVDIVIGARSAVFAPFSDIGLIVVDEEHESTYKSDMSPKYDTVEVAIKRAAAAGAAVVLGSATPSIVSSYRAERGLYKKLSLPRRYNTTPMPALIVADMRTELLKGNKSIFSEALYGAVNGTLADGKQVMLFLNRRGWSSFVSCPSCGYVMKCERCNISLTYHKAEDRAVCHYCGLSRKTPDTCPSCGKPGLRFFGLGTEQVEELTKTAFPDAVVARLDADNARKRGSGEKILSNFGAGKIDILIGTQMIAKGLDFAGVALVGIVAADISLNIPDFKSPERTFQLITQVAGRAGRREERGHVVIQTYIPENYAIEAAASHDYEGFYRSELFFRKTLSYPPFSDVVQITSYAADEEAALKGAERVRQALLAARELPPELPPELPQRAAQSATQKVRPPVLGLPPEMPQRAAQSATQKVRPPVLELPSPADRGATQKVRPPVLPLLFTEEFLLGPRPAPIAKIGDDFRYHLYVKAETKKRKALELALMEIKQEINVDPAAGFRILIDVNPYSLM